MIKKTLKFTFAAALGMFFLWLALRHVHLREAWEHTKHSITFWWIPPFCVTVLLSNWLRAERWRLLIEHEKKDISGITLLAGVLTGYILNFVGPRFGDASRPVYVARQEQLKSSKLMGTIVLERAIDMATLIILMVIVGIYIISDVSLLRQIFGTDIIDFFTGGISLQSIGWTAAVAAVLALIIWAAYRSIKKLSPSMGRMQQWSGKIKGLYYEFKDGLLAVRNVDRWWLFIIYTIMLWGCYTLMTYIPFYMFDMPATYHLGIISALTITVVSAIGIAIPVPGGIGTYHYLVKQTLLVVFTVPAVTGIAYATVTHAATLLTAAVLTPVTLTIDKWNHARQGHPPT